LGEKDGEIARLEAELEKEKGKNLKLKAQINRDHENSSISSGSKPARKKILNCREKTGRKPGGQPGHPGHARKRQIPTNIVNIPPPNDFLGNPEYVPTGKTVSRQMVNITVNLIVDEYQTPEFRHVKTGQFVHAEFPEGVENDVNYGGSVKSAAFLLNNQCNVSIDKTRELLAELTGGRPGVSKGWINGLAGEFSLLTGAWRKAAFADILLEPVMNTDFTTARVDGRNVQVIVCAAGDRTIYSARENKGHRGIAGTPVMDYQGILVHDHDKTFYNYAAGHQECLAHVLRYLKGSMENEPHLRWNTLMHGLIREMIHYRNTLGDEWHFDGDSVGGYEKLYREILDAAKGEYERCPPSDYYREGYNLCRRLGEYADSHLLFLHDGRVPATNNLSERHLRKIKRKQKQAMTFRSFGSLGHLCDCMGVIVSLKGQGKNLFEEVTAIFNG
jgi:hypothetical protein